jgi:hypothetical protein
MSSFKVGDRIVVIHAPNWTDVALCGSTTGVVSDTGREESAYIQLSMDNAKSGFTVIWVEPSWVVHDYVYDSPLYKALL